MLFRMKKMSGDECELCPRIVTKVWSAIIFYRASLCIVRYMIGQFFRPSVCLTLVLCIEKALHHKTVLPSIVSDFEMVAQGHHSNCLTAA